MNQGANNWPLRGTKATEFEGGIRNVAIVHGNMLPESGIERDNFMHISDWYPTLINLAGGNSQSSDAYDMWPSIT